MASPVWQFYVVCEKDNTLAICNVCTKQIPRGGKHAKHFNTTNLIRHLKVSHVKEYEQFSKLASAKRERDSSATHSAFYLSEPVIAQSGQPLVYWQNNKSRFPALAQAARTYLCAPCTSVDSERLFINLLEMLLPNKYTVVNS
uniref:BED-type domain-containing protein n=1 Tax=Oryzias sinensis TaxID=183150 RepID=A0A8C7ZPT4_9TELE